MLQELPDQLRKHWCGGTATLFLVLIARTEQYLFLTPMNNNAIKLIP